MSRSIRDAIRDLYKNMDDLVGRVLETLPEDTVLMVMSDHGFKSFKRGVNLNTWLHQNGYLAVKDRPHGHGVVPRRGLDPDQGLRPGIGRHLPQFGRPGSSRNGQAGRGCAGFKAGDHQGLRKLYDEEWSLDAVGEVYDTREVYKGPYVEEALIWWWGLSRGYRVSWTCATGAVTEEVFEDNEKSWSGDHCVNPPDVPGILFCNRKIDADQVSIMDIGPTVLDLFGVPVPDYCDGQPLKVQVP